MKPKHNKPVEEVVPEKKYNYVIHAWINGGPTVIRIYKKLVLTEKELTTLIESTINTGIVDTFENKQRFYPKYSIYYIEVENNGEVNV